MKARSRRRAHWMFLATMGAASVGCYDSRWGEQERLQRQHAAQTAPTLTVEDRPPGDAGGPPTAARALRVRVYATHMYTTQVVDVPRTLRELFEDANGVTEPALGVRLELEGIRSWEATRDDDLEKLLAELRTTDSGNEVDCVVGLVGSLPRVTDSFHQLGMASMPGRHIVMRAPTDASQHDAVERSYSELSADERRNVQKAHRHHRSAAVFLHEVGHALGSPHERSEKSLMYPAYRRQMTAFGPNAILAMRTVLERREAMGSGNELALYRDLGATIRQASDGVFFEEERVRFLEDLDRHAAALTVVPPRPPVASTTPVAPVPDVPELTPDDRIAFARAHELVGKGESVAAWETGKPLFGRYPQVFGVQDFRCSLATRVFPFAQARRECEILMQLARKAR